MKELTPLADRRRRFGLLRGALTSLPFCLALLAPAFLSAQGADDNEAEEITELSPFEVRATTFGYEARDTLAGSRVNSDLRDLASSISVMTLGFVEDTGATNPEEVLEYSLNVENTREYTAVANTNAFTGINFNDFGGRVRGVGFAGRQRDFFETVFQQDFYNLERITINSGPNAVIYGIGGVTGVISTQYREALTRDRYGVNLQVDSHGSNRIAIDLNQSVLDDTLAIRAIGLYSDQETYREYSDEKQRRAFVTATYRPFKSTKIRGYYERIDIEKLLPRNVVAYDGGVTNYLANVAAGASPTIDNRTGVIPSEWGAGNFVNPGAPLVTFSNANQDVWVYDQNSGFQYGAPRTRMIVTRPPGDLASNPSDDFEYSLPEGFLSKEYNLHGATTGREQYGEIWGFILNQSVGEDLAFEIGYNKERGWTDFYDVGWPGIAAVQVDMNEYLPDLVTPNPYAGMIYAEGNAQMTQELNELEGFRASATYELDLTEIHPWLGRHTAVGIYSWDRNDRYWAYTWGRTVPADEVDGYVYVGGSDAAVGGTFWRSYLDPRVGEVIQVPFDMLNGGLQPDGTFIYTLRNVPSMSNGSIFTNLTTKESYTATLQSRWFSDRLVTTVGYRDTRFGTGGRVAGGDLIRDKEQLDKSIGHYWEDTLNYGGVFHLIREDRGWGQWSIYYNWADTFNAGSGNYYADGSEIPPASGEAFDYGIMFTGLDNKLSFRLNFYESESTYDRTCAWCPTIRNQIANLEYRIGGPSEGGSNRGSYYAQSLNGTLPAGHPQWNDAFDFVLPFGQYFMTADTEAEGIELELFYRPTNNWDFRLTAAKNEATGTNLGQGWNDFAEERYDYWKSWATYENTTTRPNGNLIANENGSVTRRFNNFLPGYVTTEASDGLQVEQNAGWRVNFTGKYTFTEGTLKNFNIGSHMRLREGGVIGYLYKQTDASEVPFADFPGLNTANFFVPDIDRPVRSDDTLLFDLFMGYHGQMMNDKVRYNVRLNVRNLLNEGSINGQRAGTDGTVRIYNYQEPREFIISLDLTY